MSDHRRHAREREASWRLFFALVPPPALGQRIIELQRQLDLPARPVPLERIHITLAFLGEVPASRVDDLQRVAGMLQLPPVTLTLDRLGWFPRSQVAWLGCSEIPYGLGRFESELREKLRDLGLKTDTRRWKPHLTLYRKMRTRFEKIGFEALGWRLDGFQLMRSRLLREGPEYSSVAQWKAAEIGPD